VVDILKDRSRSNPELNGPLPLSISKPTHVKRDSEDEDFASGEGRGEDDFESASFASLRVGEDDFDSMLRVIVFIN